MYSLESPRCGDSNENTQYIFMWKKNQKDIPIKPPDLALKSTLIDSNYPCLERIFLVPKVFEQLNFDYMVSTFALRFIFPRLNSRRYLKELFDMSQISNFMQIS